MIQNFVPLEMSEKKTDFKLVYNMDRLQYIPVLEQSNQDKMRKSPLILGLNLFKNMKNFWLLKYLTEILTIALGELLTRPVFEKVF